MMARFEALQSVGFFDPAYFLYYEEVDLMYRLKQAGWKTWYVAEAEIIHHEGAATKVRSGAAERKRLPSFLYQSWRHYFHKSHGRTYTLIASAARLCGVTGNFLISFLRRRTPASPLFFYRDFWKLVLKPLLGL